MSKGSFLVGLMVGVILSGAVVGGAWVITRQESDDSTSTAQESESVQEVDENQLLFTNVYRGDGTRNGYSELPTEPLAKLVSDQASFDTLWGELFSKGLAPPKPTVDFEAQSVLVVMSAQKEKGEHLLTIQDLRYEDDTLEVTAQEKAPGEGCAQRQRVIRPIHIVLTGKIAGAETKISLEHTQAAPCQILLNG